MRLNVSNVINSIIAKLGLQMSQVFLFNSESKLPRFTGALELLTVKKGCPSKMVRFYFGFDKRELERVREEIWSKECQDCRE